MGTRALNVWGSTACKDATPLWLVLEQINYDELAMRGRIHLNGAKLPNGATNGRTQGRCVWQWRAYADFTSPHPFSADKGDNALCVQVGRVSSKNYLSSHGTDACTKAAAYDIDQMVALPQIEIFIDHRPTVFGGAP